jgi:DNA (cytosine-5)-methyltransferase 1
MEFLGKKMNYLSVCSGIEAATVAWHHMGWNPVGFSEIEKFPSEVLRHHYPNVPNLGDMTKYKEWKLNEPIDILVGGTPCQSFSVAGLRKGLEDPRGNLALTYIGILDKFRPKWCVWENVPGVLSSNGGRDFGSFLGALVELGYGFSYRVLDAQYFGVAQRRRRVFVVGCLGDWKSAAEVLFEPESLRRDTTKSRKTRKEIANCLTKSPSSHSSYNPARSEGNAVVVDWPANKAATLNANFGSKLGLENQHINGGASLFVPSIGYCNNLAPTLTSSGAGISRVGNDTTADSQYIVQQAFRKSRRAQSVDDYETWVDDGKANTLNTFDLGDARTTHAIALAENTIGRQPQNGGNGNGFTEGGPMYTLNATGVHGVAHHAISFSPSHFTRGFGMTPTNELSGTIKAKMNDNSPHIAIAHVFKVRGGCEGGDKGYLGQDEKTFTISTVQDQQIAIGVDTYNLTENTNTIQTLRGFGHIDHVGGIISNMAVRRLTLIECERLQGFPDNYTNIKANCPDGPRYKALGNSMAVPVMKWIGERINNVDNI